MPVKKTTTAKEPAQKATQTTVKVDATKNSVTEKPIVKSETVTEVKKETAGKKAEVKKTEIKKTEAKKPAAKKAPAKKTATRKTAAKKTTTRKTAAAKKAIDTKTEVFIQYQGEESSISSVMEKVNAAWEAEGKKVSAIKRAKLYVKPEDGKAYYVINEGLKNASIGAVEL